MNHFKEHYNGIEDGTYYAVSDAVSDGEMSTFNFKWPGCEYCEGTGLVYDEVEVNGKVIDGDKPCEECEGTGYRL